MIFHFYRAALLRRPGEIAPIGGRASEKEKGGKREKERKRERKREGRRLIFLSRNSSPNRRFNSPGDAALNSRSFLLRERRSSTEQHSILMTQSSQNKNGSRRETGSEGDSPCPPRSPWAEETATSSLPSQPPPPPPEAPRGQPPGQPPQQCHPKRLACEIQACFKRRGFEDPSRCAAEFEALKRCCETLTEESVHCSSDWRRKK